MLSTDKAWEKFGRQAPYFGVLADEKFAAEQDPRKPRGILRDRPRLRRALARALRAALRRASAGESARPRLRRRPAHLSAGGRVRERRRARRLAVHARGGEVERARIRGGNVEFALADDHLSNAEGEFDFVNSYITLAAHSGPARPDDPVAADRQGEAGRRVPRPSVRPHRPQEVARPVVGEPSHPRSEDLAERHGRAALERAGDADEQLSAGLGVHPDGGAGRDRVPRARPNITRNS